MILALVLAGIMLLVIGLPLLLAVSLCRVSREDRKRVRIVLGPATANAVAGTPEIPTERVIFWRTDNRADRRAFERTLAQINELSTISESEAYR